MANNLYLYLAKRDKTEINLIAVLSGASQTATRLDEKLIKSLQLPAVWHTKISQIIHDNRMAWEPWIQSAENYAELRKNLKIRGYKNVPVSGKPSFSPSFSQNQTVNVAALPHRETMIRKKTN